MAGGGTSRSRYGPSPMIMSTIPGSSLKWPLGGTEKGHAPWNSLLPLASVALLLRLHAARKARPAAPPPKSSRPRRGAPSANGWPFRFSSGGGFHPEKGRRGGGLVG